MMRSHLLFACVVFFGAASSTRAQPPGGDAGAPTKKDEGAAFAQKILDLQFSLMKSAIEASAKEAQRKAEREAQREREARETALRVEEETQAKRLRPFEGKLAVFLDTTSLREQTPA